MTTSLCRRILLWALVSTLTVAAGPSTALAEQNPRLDIGIAPYYSTQLLFQQYEPLRAHLEQVLQRPTYLGTAKDFRTFALRPRAHDYPYIITVPHFGRLAQVDDGYQPLAQMKAMLQGVFVVKKDDRATTLADLKGRVVATPDRLAIITLMGEQALTEAGLGPDRTVRIVPKPTHNAAALSVISGEVDAALVWHSTMASMESGIADDLRIIGTTVTLPTFVLFLAAPEIPAAEAATMRAAILGFGETDEGRAFFRRTAYGGLAPVSADEISHLDVYLPSVRRALDRP